MYFHLHCLRNGWCTPGPHRGSSSPLGLGIRKGTRKLEAGERELVSPPSPGACCFLRKWPAGETAGLLGMSLDRWGPRTGEGLERGCPFSQSRPEIPVCPFPPKRTQWRPSQSHTPPGVCREPPSHRQTQPPPHPRHREPKRGSWAGRREEARGGQARDAGPGALRGQERGRLPGAGAPGAAGRTGDGGSSSSSSGNRSETLRPAEGER